MAPQVSLTGWRVWPAAGPALLLCLACGLSARAGEASPGEGARPPAKDIFDELPPQPPPPAAKPAEEHGWLYNFTHDNFTLKKELYSQGDYNDELPGSRSVYSRQSVGMELLKKFSTRTATVAAFDVQLRFVRRDTYHEVWNDMEGVERPGWFVEVHNLYWDFYNFLNPVLPEDARGEQTGRFNFRLGRFYLPLGLNLQTDTHGTLLQLSNDRNLGFERDGYAGLWGAVNPDVNYDVYYLLGSGYDISFKGQKGLLGARFSLASKYKNELGLEAGIGAVYGGRISKDAVERSPSVEAEAGRKFVVDTLRFGPDVRYTRAVPSGELVFLTELTAGRDESDAVFTQLHQLEYLHRSRHWGLATQYRRFWQDIRRGALPADEPLPRRADASLIGEFTWYFRNDITATNLHWIKLNVERQTERQLEKRATKVSLQYYRYW